MVRQRKTLQELTIKDNFMFAAVMLEPDNAKGLLELVLGIEVDYVEISQEKSIVYNPEYRGVRLDVYIKDNKGTHFNVEMQAVSQPLVKRERYYHSQMDMELLVRGTDYENLPDGYVIFICDFDPLGMGKYRYSIRKRVDENLEYNYPDGSYTVFLSTVGTNENEVPKALVKFLKFVAAKPESSNDDFDDKYIRQLQYSVEKIKTSRDMEGRFMLFEEMMKNEYKAGHEDGKAEGKLEGKLEDILQLLNARFTVPDTLPERISRITDENVLSKLHIDAAVSASIEDFERELDKQLSF